MIPPALERRFIDLLGAPLEPPRAVGGGDINAALVWRSARGQYFIKWNSRLGADAFAAEAAGLARLAAAGALAVACPVAHGAIDGAGFLVLDWLTPAQPTPDAWRTLGAGLAALHRHGSAAYGLERDNYIGSLPQPNGEYAAWPRFWAERRLAPMLRRAVDAGLVDGNLRARIERLCTGAETACRREGLVPSLLHGDLWRGNVLFTREGPVLIDPAVYVGDREVELAFTELFGGFDDGFYAAYSAAFPPAPGYAERRPYWQLYPLLVHLNLFGAAYVGQVARAALAAEKLLA